MGETKTLITVEQFEAMSFPDERVELLEGELVRMPPAGARHGAIACNVAAILGGFARTRKLGRVLTAGAGFHINENTVRAPDVSFLSSARVHAEGLPKGFFRGAPDLAVEIVSPSDSAAELARKIQEYLAAGAKAVWVLYPDLRQLHVYGGPREVRVLQASDTLTSPKLLSDFAVPVAEFFEE